MVTFTGSTKVGRSLVANESGRLKRFSLELGGHAPGIVLAHSDVDRVVEAILVSKFRNAGQSCIALNRLFVHRSLYAEVIEKLVAAVRLLKVGNGMDPQTDIGPLIGQASAEKLEAQIQDAVAAGARILVGGNRSPHSDAESGTFFEPTVIADVPDSCALTRDEIFGPVLPVFQFDDVAEVIQRANDTSYGLASYVFGTDLREVTRVVEDLQFGVIGVNEPVPSALELPFGGEGDSGFGREGGSEGIGEFLTTKSILMAP
jgi:succinate-semialdehyde dehydrogenase/glutarate-semialdehyde dehydrogenase